MPSLPHIPGKSLVTDATKRARVISGAAGAGVVAVGGLVAKRVLGGRGGDETDTDVASDPIAQTPTAPQGGVPKPTPPVTAAAPKAKAAKPKPPKTKVKSAPKPKADKPKPAPRGQSAEPKAKAPAKAKAKAAAKPTTTTGTDAPPNPAVEPGNISGDKEPHHALNTPVGDPDETGYPDPVENRDKLGD